jgi:hypothetical protein
MPERCCYGFVPNPTCESCQGTGIFAEDDEGRPTEACVFCAEDAEDAGVAVKHEED